MLRFLKIGDLDPEVKMTIKLANEREMATVEHILYNTRSGILTARHMDEGTMRNALFDLGNGATANQVVGVERLEAEEFVRKLHSVAGRDRYEFVSCEREDGMIIDYVRKRIATTREISPPPALLRVSHPTPVTSEFPNPRKR